MSRRPRKGSQPLIGLAWLLLLLAIPAAGLAQSDANGVYTGTFESCDTPDDGEFSALVSNGVGIFIGSEPDEDVSFVVENVPVQLDGSFDYSPPDAAPLTRLQGSVSGGTIVGFLHFALESCNGQQPNHADAFSGTRSEAAGIFSDEAGYYQGTIAEVVLPEPEGASYRGETHAILDPVGRLLVFYRIELTVGTEGASIAFSQTFAIGVNRTFSDGDAAGTLSAAGVEPPVVTGTGPDFVEQPLQWTATRVLALVAGSVTPDQLLSDGGPREGILARASEGDWTRLNEFSPDSMVAADLDDDGQDELVVDLGEGYGIWIFDGAAWRALSPSTAESMLKIDDDADPRDDIVVDFGPGVGVRIWMNDTTWKDQSAESPESMLAWPTDVGTDLLLMDCGPRLGIWFRQCHVDEPPFGSNQFDTLSPASMIAIDFDRGSPDSRTKILADFGPDTGTVFRFGHLFDSRFGLWLHDPGSTSSGWVALSAPSNLAGVSPEQMVVGDVNGSVKDDLIVDFGAGRGVYVLLDGATWQAVSAASPLSMVAGDLDGNGLDEIIMDLGPGSGIVTWSTEGGPQPLDQRSGRSLVVLNREVQLVPEPGAAGLQLATIGALACLGAAARRRRLARARSKPGC